MAVSHQALVVKSVYVGYQKQLRLPAISIARHFVTQITAVKSAKLFSRSIAYPDDAFHLYAFVFIIIATLISAGSAI